MIQYSVFINYNPGDVGRKLHLDLEEKNKNWYCAYVKTTNESERSEKFLLYKSFVCRKHKSYLKQVEQNYKYDKKPAHIPIIIFSNCSGGKVYTCHFSFLLSLQRRYEQNSRYECLKS